jgi:hypothetical protein
VRNAKAWQLLRDQFLTDVELSQRLSFTLSARPVIRSADRESRAVLQMEKAISSSLSAGYNLWYHNEETTDW